MNRFVGACLQAISWSARPARERSAPASRAERAPARPEKMAGFRTKVLVWMMLIVTAVTGLALYFAQRSVAANFERDLQREFQVELAALQNTRAIRHAAVVERCRALVRKPRITQAIEEDLSLLYLNAKEELRDIVERPRAPDAAPSDYALSANFYRFLDQKGQVISPSPLRTEGALSPAEEASLALPGPPDREHIGYLMHTTGAAKGTISEVIAMPIISTETGEAIAALVLGFKPFEFGRRANEMKSGIWVEGRLHSSTIEPATARTAAEIMRRRATTLADTPAQIEGEGTHQLVFAKRLNPGSLYPPAYEVCIFPLGELIDQQRDLRWQVVGGGALLLLLGLGASHFASVRLSAPVEKLAVDSERSARFSADASHQLKTPVTVLRAGLEELLAREHLSPEECHQVSALIHQTYRLSTLIEDLLLLSRMDAGRLQLDLAPVNLTQLIEASLDDLSALPDELSLDVKTEFPAALHILGEKRHTAIILQNLLENARKYNRRGGRIRIEARGEGDTVRLVVANTGRPIAPATQAHIFERFHRGEIGENVPGYGLGLNLARELARLHHGELRLLRSDESWTEFEVMFRRVEGVA